MGSYLAKLGQLVPAVVFPDSPKPDGSSYAPFYTRFDGDSTSAQDGILRAMLRVKTWQAIVHYTSQEVTGAYASGGDPPTGPSNGPTTDQSQTLDLKSQCADEQALLTKLFGSPPYDYNYVTDGPVFSDDRGNDLCLPLFVNGGASDPTFPFFIAFSLFVNVMLAAYGHTSASGSETLNSRTGGPTYGPQQLPDALTFLEQTWTLTASTAIIYDPGQSFPNYRYTLFTLKSVTLTEQEFWTYGGIYDPTSGAPT